MSLERLASSIIHGGQTTFRAGYSLARRVKRFVWRIMRRVGLIAPVREASTATSPSIRRVAGPGGDSVCEVTGYDEVKAAYSDPRLRRSHPEPERATSVSDAAIFQLLMPGSPFSNDSQHTWLRRVLAPAFSPRRLASLQPRVQALVNGLLDEMEGRPRPVDFHASVSVPLPVQVICELLGVPFADREDFQRWSHSAHNTADAAGSRAGFAQLEAYIRTILQRKRQQPCEDVLSDLVVAQQRTPDAISDDDLVKVGAGLLVAGNLTTVASIDKAMVLLLTQPAVLRALQADPTLIPRAVEEVFRLPIPAKPTRTVKEVGHPRFASTDMEFGGVTIDKGEMVLLRPDMANLDARVFPQPGTFDLTREQNPHLAFGYGVYYCLGAPLARIELQVALETVVRRYSTLRLAVPPEDLRVEADVLIGSLVELPVTW